MEFTDITNATSESIYVACGKLKFKLSKVSIPVL